MVLGDLLARRRRVQLDRRALDLCLAPRPGSPGDPSLRASPHARVGVCVWRAVGTRRSDVRTHHALSRHRARCGRGARLLRRVRDADSADCQRRDRPNRRQHLGTRDPSRRRRLPARHRAERLGWTIEGARALVRTEGRDDSRVRLRQGHAGRDVLRRDELLLRLRPCRREAAGRAHPRSTAPGGPGRSLAEPARPDRRPARRLHHQCRLVRDPQCEKPIGGGVHNRTGRAQAC